MQGSRRPQAAERWLKWHRIFEASKGSTDASKMSWIRQVNPKVAWRIQEVGKGGVQIVAKPKRKITQMKTGTNDEVQIL
jgi:hypothetical protein